MNNDRYWREKTTGSKETEKTMKENITKDEARKVLDVLADINDYMEMLNYKGESVFKTDLETMKLSNPDWNKELVNKDNLLAENLNVSWNIDTPAGQLLRPEILGLFNTARNVFEEVFNTDFKYQNITMEASLSAVRRASMSISVEFLYMDNNKADSETFSYNLPLTLQESKYLRNVLDKEREIALDNYKEQEQEMER